MKAKDMTELDSSEDLDALWSFPLFEAIMGRRSRRFGLGMELKDGPNAYKSKHPPVPLSEKEEAILIAAGTGISGFSLCDTPHTNRPPKASDLDQWCGSFNFMDHVGRTWPSGCSSHGTQLFYTNDDGVYFLDFRDAQASKMREFENVKDRSKLAGAVAPYRKRLSDKRLDLPRNTKAVQPYNLWNVNMPGTTLFLPVTDITEEHINRILLMADTGRYIVDDRNGYRPCGNERWVKDGYVNTPVPLSKWEQRSMVQSSVEAGLINHNIMLASQALGLGGWAFTSINSVVAMGGRPSAKGLGFRFEPGPEKPGENPRPLGIDGVFESFRPPYFKNMDAAVDAVAAKKFGPNGTFAPEGRKPAPYADRSEYLKKVPPQPEKSIQLAKDTCNYIWETYGRFPAFIDPMIMWFYVQIHHLDLDFYDKFYKPGSYLATHKDHMKKWHGKR